MAGEAAASPAAEAAEDEGRAHCIARFAELRALVESIKSFVVTCIKPCLAMCLWQRS